MAVNNAVNNVLYGSTTGVAKTAGQVGEIIQSIILLSAPVVVGGFGAPQNLTFITVTPGNWRISGNVSQSSATYGTVTGMVGCASLVSGTYPDAAKYGAIIGTSGTTILGITIPTLYLNVSVNTPVYLIIYVEGTGGPVSGCGQIFAERMC